MQINGNGKQFNWIKNAKGLGQISIKQLLVSLHFQQRRSWRTKRCCEETHQERKQNVEITIGALKAYFNRDTTYQARRRFSRDHHATVSSDLKTVLSAY